MKEIPCFIEREKENHIDTEYKISKNFIQTYKDNHIHDTIYDNIMSILDKNKDFNYYLITDDIGVELINEHFDKYTLDAYNRLNIGAAKGDFLRYIAMYVYGGVYLDLDSSIKLSLSSFIKPEAEFIFFVDGDCNVQQWCFMVAPKNPIMLNLIKEMVTRIYDEERNIFLATGPTLFTDVVYNSMNNTNIYNSKLIIPKAERMKSFMKNKNFMNGMMIYENDETINFRNNFHFRMINYSEDMLYNNDKYIVTFDEPTPNFYKTIE
jgi:mannosyltransferase OCH1-like enzyme